VCRRLKARIEKNQENFDLVSDWIFSGNLFSRFLDILRQNGLQEVTLIKPPCLKVEFLTYLKEDNWPAKIVVFTIKVLRVIRRKRGVIEAQKV